MVENDLELMQDGASQPLSEKANLQSCDKASGNSGAPGDEWDGEMSPAFPDVSAVQREDESPDMVRDRGFDAGESVMFGGLLFNGLWKRRVQLPLPDQVTLMHSQWLLAPSHCLITP